MRIAIFGASWAGQSHAAAYASMPDVRIAAIVGRSEARAKALADRVKPPAVKGPIR